MITINIMIMMIITIIIKINEPSATPIKVFTLTIVRILGILTIIRILKIRIPSTILTKQSQAKPSRAKQSRGKQSKAKQSKAKQSRANSNETAKTIRNGHRGPAEGADAKRPEDLLQELQDQEESYERGKKRSLGTPRRRHAALTIEGRGPHQLGERCVRGRKLTIFPRSLTDPPRMSSIFPTR